MPFTKIKFTGILVELHWSKIRKDGGESIGRLLKSSDQPLPEFVEALAAFTPFVLEILELDDSWKEGLRVQSVSVTIDEDECRGIVITCLKKIAASPSPAVINTPFLTENEDSENVFLPGMSGALNILEAEAERYKNRERAQKDLFGGEKPKRLSDDITSVTISAPGHEPVTMTGRQFEQLPDKIAARGRRLAS